jgi:hypothetical protein
VIDNDRKGMVFLWDLTPSLQGNEQGSKDPTTSKKPSITNAFTVTLPEAFNLHVTAFVKYKKDKKDDEEHRQSFYLRLASDRVKKI